MAASLPSALTNAHTPAFGLEPGLITEVHAFWLAGMSCDGCSIAAVGGNASLALVMAVAGKWHPQIVAPHSWQCAEGMLIYCLNSGAV